MLDRLLANWPLKLLALVLAFAIWVSITGEARVVQDFRVPLEIELPADLTPASSPPTTVSVRLRGAESLMRRLDPVPITVRADLRDASNGHQEVLLRRDDVRGVPRGVDIDFIDPDRVPLDLDARSRRELPVEPTILGQPAEGYALYTAQVTPGRLRIDGPAAQVDRLEVLRTTPIRLDGRTETFVVRSAVAPEGELVRVLDPGALTVRVVIDAAAVERRLENVKVEAVGVPPGSTVAPDALHVILSGPPRLVDRLAPGQVRLYAEVTQAPGDASRLQVPVRVELAGLGPDDRSRIQVKSISRRQVVVTLSGRRSL
jgi:YbbR domain-containing protein